MKRTLITLALVLVTFAIVKADDRPVTFNQLPQAAQTFINTNYPDEKVAFATVDDDFIRPDYHVALVSGVMLQFEHGGSLEKIETRNGNIPAGIIPFQIIDMVKQYYPEAQITEYEIGKRSYEVKLSNRMEMKFNTKFQIIELDD
jgi:hypothetical protein